MLTFFTTAKPFRGHFNVIQRNALQSWRLLHPGVEILLFGDEEGYAGAARDFGLRHVPEVAKNEFGTILVSGMFERAQALASHDLLCYVNCDIVLLPDFRSALEQILVSHPSSRRSPLATRLPAVASAKEGHFPFLMIGRRWDLDITEPLPFANSEWHCELRGRAIRRGRRRAPHWIDYFAFSRGAFGTIPDFAVGRTCWDNWLVWNAAASGSTVIDATPAVVAVHQNHDYGHCPSGYAGAWFGQEAERNRQLAGSLQHFFTIAHATHSLGASGIQSKRFYRLTWAWWRIKRIVTELTRRPRGAWQNALWHPFLNATRPLRSALGLRKRLSVAQARKP